jgi:hypothetical protein
VTLVVSFVSIATPFTVDPITDDPPVQIMSGFAAYVTPNPATAEE